MKTSVSCSADIKIMRCSVMWPQSIDVV
jgi:hypothetical protein